MRRAISIQAAPEYQEEGLQVVGVHLDELASDSFRVAGTPALFLVDKQGGVAFSNVGAVTGERMKAEIEKVAK